MKKIGILTFHRAMNYGAILQCYALQEILKNYPEFEIQVIDYTPKNFHEVYRRPYCVFDYPYVRQKLGLIKWWFKEPNILYKTSKKYYSLNKFISNKLSLSEKFERDELPLLNKDFDIFIVGSDQVWNLGITDNDESFLLDFVQINKIKIAYAASFSVKSIDENNLNIFDKWLNSFNAISLREKDNVDFINERYGINCQCVLDPTLLISSKEWIRLLNINLHEKKYKQENYILIYIVGNSEKLVDYAFRYAEEKGSRVISLNELKGKKGYINFSNASIEQFVALICNARCVFTTSYHGLVFSINFHKSFYFEVAANSSNNNERLLHVTGALGLSSRNIDTMEENNIEWDKVDQTLQFMRTESIVFLMKAIGIIE